jgi:hypothetical protein
VERALDTEIRSESTIPAGARALLRAAAAFVDVAERSGDVDAGAKSVRAYLELRQACGLTGTMREALDPFAAFVAGMSAPELRHSPDAEPR